MRHILRKIIEELVRVVPAIIYFMIVFNVIHLTGNLLRQPDDKQYFTEFTIMIGALIAGKVVLIVNALPFINLFPTRPLIYNILWKFFIYGVVIFCCWILDAFSRAFYHFDNANLAWQHLDHALWLPIIWTTYLWLLLIFFNFIVFAEFGQAIGVKKMIRMLFVNRNG